MPRPSAGRHDAMPWEVEQRLAALAGVEPTPRRAVEDDDPIAGTDGAVRPALDESELVRRVLRVAEVVTLGSFVLLVAAAALAARFGDGSLHVHEIPFAGWGLVATAAAVTLAALSGDSSTTLLHPARRRVVGPVLVVALLVAMTGVVANADGVAGPAWVLFLPLVLVAGAVTGPAIGLLIGAGAASGVYAAAGLSDTLNVAGV